jgi:hypothetical protein
LDDIRARKAKRKATKTIQKSLRILGFFLLSYWDINISPRNREYEVNKFSITRRENKTTHSTKEKREAMKDQTKPLRTFEHEQKTTHDGE